MKMIWHDAVCKHSHRNPLTSQPNQLHKGAVITVLMEYLDLRVSSINDVIADVTHRGSGRARHKAIYPGACSLGKRKEKCPLYPPWRETSQLQSFLSRTGEGQESKAWHYGGFTLKCTAIPPYAEIAKPAVRRHRPRQPNVPIQSAMAWPISSGESS